MPQSEKSYLVTKAWSFQDGAFRDFEHERARNLQKYGSRLSPSVEVLICSDRAITRQNFVGVAISKNRVQTNSNIEALSRAVDSFHFHNIVHGDLCMSNIGVDKDGKIFIFDWEPKLIIGEGARVQFRSSKYCLHPIDKVNLEVTKHSDRFAVASLFLQVRFDRYTGLKVMRAHFDEVAEISGKSKNCNEMLSLLSDATFV